MWREKEADILCQQNMFVVLVNYFQFTYLLCLFRILALSLNNTLYLELCNSDKSFIIKIKDWSKERKTYLLTKHLHNTITLPKAEKQKVVPCVRVIILNQTFP